MWESKHELFAPIARGNAKRPVGREDAPSSAVLLPLAGLLSALLSAGLGNSIGVLAGGVFGAVMGIALVMTKMLEGAWKVTLLIVQIAIAYLFAYIAAILIQGFFINQILGVGAPSKTSPVAVFAGGVVGGFIVLAVFSTMACYPEVGIQTLIVKSLAWSPVAGVLAVVGWLLGSTLGMAVWYVFWTIGLTGRERSSPYGDTSQLFSLFVIWQTGMGVVLSRMLESSYKPLTEPSAQKNRLR
jgi:hypothetical protein